MITQNFKPTCTYNVYMPELRTENRNSNIELFKKNFIDNIKRNRGPI